MDELLQQLINGLALGAIYALVAIGYTMVYGVLRFINFAHGDVFMVGAAVGLASGSFYLNHIGPPSTGGFLLVLLVSMASCGLLGFLIELLAYRPLRLRPKITVLITAIGVSLLLQFGFQHPAVFGPDARAFPPVLPWADATFEPGGDLVIFWIDLLIVGLTIGLTILLTLLIRYTRIGMAIRAVSYRVETASLMGINANRVISLTFVIGSMLAAAGGVLWACKYPNVHPLMGMMPGIKAFIAAVLGGIGSIWGAVLGGVLIGLIETLVGSLDGGSQYRDAVAFVILIGVLLIRPSGLLGSSAHEKV